MKQKSIKIAVIGLGYVGLPLAVEFSKKYAVVGFDLKQQRIEDLKKSIDRTGEVYDKDLENSPVLYTSNSRDIEGCNFIVVAVPTPIKKNKSPDLSPLLNASKIVGQADKYWAERRRASGERC